MAPFPVEQAFRGRASAEGATLDGDVYVLTGNIFEDEEVVAQMGEGGGGGIAAFGDSGRAPGAYPAGQVAELDDGATLVVETNGDYTYTTTEDPGSRGPRIYFIAETPPEFSLDNYRTVLTADNMDQAFINTLTVTVPATIIPILIAAFAAYALAWMDFPGQGSSHRRSRRTSRRAVATCSCADAAASQPYRDRPEFSRDLASAYGVRHAARGLSAAELHGRTAA